MCYNIYVESREIEKMINILYIHGYNSSSTSPSVKITQLENEFKTVYRIAPDYDLGYESALKEVLDFVEQIKSEGSSVDALVGTSMGGYLAADVSQKLVVPYVSINPCIYPSLSLEKYGLIGDELHSYPDFSVDSAASGLVLLGMQDNVIDPYETMMFLNNRLPLMIDDACHQFPSLEKHIDKIAIFLFSASAYGPSSPKSV